MHQSTEQDTLDFDNWMALAKDNPTQFESMRLDAIDEFIESAPEERKIHLRRLQWRIDMARERAGSPMAATLAISRMMWDAFHNLKESYDELFSEEDAPRRVTETHKLAQVIAFRPQLVEV